MYRILSPTAILGYGFPEASFNAAMELELDLIAVDAGSMDAGPYYLGAGTHYVGDTALERDLRLMIEGAIQQNCPLIIGSAGFAGSSPQFDQVVDRVKLLLVQLAVPARLATIRSDLQAPLSDHFVNTLKPLGAMPELDFQQLAQSKMVAQMGIEPIISALEAGAQFIVCGRSYDPALFAADPIRHGYPRGAAYHAAKILECGAIACEPGSGSDCLIAEINRDGSAVFYPTNPVRKATANSIAAHTLYEKSAPDIFHLPGGILNIRNTRFYQVDERKAGFSGSEFIERPYSLKVEGCRFVGERVISLIPVTDVRKIDESIRVYGRNAVEIFNGSADVPETGLLITVTSQQAGPAKDALAFIRSTLLHYGYEGRISTAGNLAFPFSPSDMLMRGDENQYQYFFIAGTRDPVFQDNWSDIQYEVLSILKAEHPELERQCKIAFVLANQDNPLALLESIGPDLESAEEKDQQQRNSLSAYRDQSKTALEGVSADKAYQWSIHHLVTDKKLISNIFTPKVETLAEHGWQTTTTCKPQYNLSEGTDFSPLKESPNDIAGTQVQPAQTNGTASLRQLATVIRSKNSGINQITFDIIFKSSTAYQAAVKSGLFGRQHLSRIFEVPENHILGCYKFDPVRAIKFTVQRPGLSGSPGDNDVFGAQQHTRLLDVMIPYDT